jgi:hypothetical protein
MPMWCGLATSARATNLVDSHFSFILPLLTPHDHTDLVDISKGLY